MASMILRTPICSLACATLAKASASKALANPCPCTLRSTANRAKTTTEGLGRLQGHQLCQGLGAAMVRRSRSLACGGASRVAAKRSNGSAPTLSQVCSISSSWAAKRAACNTKLVRVRPEALTAFYLSGGATSKTTLMFIAMQPFPSIVGADFPANSCPALILRSSQAAITPTR